MPEDRITMISDQNLPQGCLVEIVKLFLQPDLDVLSSDEKTQRAYQEWQKTDVNKGRNISTFIYNSFVSYDDDDVKLAWKSVLYSEERNMRIQHIMSKLSPQALAAAKEIVLKWLLRFPPSFGQGSGRIKV